MRSLLLLAGFVALLGIGLLVLTRDLVGRPVIDSSTAPVSARSGTRAEAPHDAETVPQPRAESGSNAEPVTVPRAEAPSRDNAVVSDEGLPARAVRAEVIADVRDSGVARGTWAAAGVALLRAIDARRTTDVACYAGGCTAVVEFAVDDDYQRALAAWQDSAAYARWAGVKQLTPAEARDDGSVVVGVVLYPPN